MEFLDFVNIVTELKEKKPTLFGLCGDNISTYEKIEEAERYFGIKFPESYKDFLKKYGGGYFAYTVVYSCDPGSGFYLVDNVSKEWVYENDFFPVIDFETGDLGGFRITDHSCDQYFSIYDHEEKRIVGNKEYDFYQALIKYGLKCIADTNKE